MRAADRKKVETPFPGYLPFLHVLSTLTSSASCYHTLFGVFVFMPFEYLDVHMVDYFSICFNYKEFMCDIFVSLIRCIFLDPHTHTETKLCDSSCTVQLLKFNLTFYPPTYHH